MIKTEIIEKLNSAAASERLEAAAEVSRLFENGHEEIVMTEEVNNHVHTCYSFSPYSPSMAAFRARQAGLKAVGIMDHDSVAGAREMIEACKSLGIASTVGYEVRVNFNGTAVEGRKLNNPDSENIVYIAVHGVPESKIEKADNFLALLRMERKKRIYRMVEKLNGLIEKYGIRIDFDRDVCGASKASEGGALTERHILFALAQKLIQKFGKGSRLISFLTGSLGTDLPEKIAGFLLDGKNPHYMFDLLGILKSSFLEKIFIQPDYVECISVFKAVDFANSINAIPAYAYLGDVGESPTGDKKAEKFEDDFLDELVPELKKIGFKAITYMPPRNTLAQLRRVRKLCAENKLMEISGVDINSSRQSFNYQEMMRPEFSHLIDSTWALIAHEKLANYNDSCGLFHPQNPLAGKSLQERIEVYSVIGRKIDYRHPEKAGERLWKISALKLSPPSCEV